MKVVVFSRISKYSQLLTQEPFPLSSLIISLDLVFFFHVLRYWGLKLASFKPILQTQF